MQGSFKSSGGGLGGSGGMGGGFGGMRNPFNQGKLADAKRFGIISEALMLISAIKEHLPRGERHLRACGQRYRLQRQIYNYHRDCLRGCFDIAKSRPHDYRRAGGSVFHC